MLPQFDENFTNLAFLNIEFSGASIQNCQKCFNFSKDCDACQDNKSRLPVFCCVLIETKRGQFEERIFTEFKGETRTPDSFVTVYFADAVQQSKLINQSNTKFGKKKKFSLQTNPFDSTKKSVLEKCLAEIFEEKLGNTTFVFFDDTRQYFDEIMKCLLKNGITPHTTGGTDTFVIEVPQLDIRFINLQNYVEGNFYDLTRARNKPCQFFPHVWLKKTKFDYCGEQPPLNAFENFEDDEDIVNLKKIHVASLQSPWNFKLELIAYGQKKCHLLADIAINFLNHSFLCQHQILKFLAPSTDTKRAVIHPFNRPLFTKAGYAYKLMCLFSKHLKDVRIVKPPVHMASSKGELEYCLFKEWQDPEKTHIHAWSPSGQQKFAESFPDLYIPEEKFCGFWNGCNIHGHPLEQCKFRQTNKKSKKNIFDVSFEEAYVEYMKKKEKLASNHKADIFKIEEVWQCEWQERKKTDDSLQYFLKHIYREPPLYRLDARKAVRGGINEVYRCFFNNKLSPFNMQKLNYLDMISAHPFSAFGTFPVGNYQVYFLYLLYFN